MSNRIRPGLVRTLVHLAVLLLAYTVRALVPVPAPALSDAVRRPPGYRIFCADAEIPVCPAYLFRRGRRAHPVAEPEPPSRIRPYLVAHEQRSRRTALALALDGIDVGPEVIHGHRVGSPVPAAPMGVAA
ncbi:hypothetical protein [Streptomyces mirabilis]|uniref:hypothetical protein n=1 Tax=Streptomyces mirabilis TaxID=68239 RepID=UPI003719390C